MRDKSVILQTELSINYIQKTLNKKAPPASVADSAFLYVENTYLIKASIASKFGRSPADSNTSA
jgi:hypothetical protein